MRHLISNIEHPSSSQAYTQSATGIKPVAALTDIHYVVFIIFLLALVGCGDSNTNQTPKKTLDTPTTGEISVMIDEGYQPIVASTIDVFHSLYKRAKINPIYTSEGEAIKAITADSIQVIVITRKLTANELEYFTQRGFTPKITPVAYDAVGFIVNPANRDTVFSEIQMRDILTGKITNWSQVNPRSKLGDIRLVFDNPLSGTVRYAKDSICGGAPLSPKASAMNINTDVIGYVAKQKNAIGIISANWISDADDKGVQKFLKEIALVDIAKTEGAEGFGPYQAYLATGQYPYKRTVYVINAQARNGLGLGFASFLAGDTGQRIVLKDGMLPAQAPIRLMKVIK
jgi:phosphate transport system substrate-binding protein